MKISLNWIKQYVDIPKDFTPQELALRLTMSVVEVDAVEDQKSRYDNMVVGEVLNVVDHPQADKLKVCKVKAGSAEYQVICGGSNVRKGLKGVLALPGALVKWHGQGNLVKLSQAKIRGVESEGMLCAAAEIDLADEFNEPTFTQAAAGREDGIVELTAGKSGQPVAEVLGLNDVILDIDNKSLTNRPDLWGHYGLAREVAALLGKKLKPLELNEKIVEDSQVDLKIDIQDAENCSRYLGAVMGNIRIAPSPRWLQNFLKAVGVRPINNVVDVTNFVMLELGRPSHAFDRLSIHQDTITVRRAAEGEKFKTLDGVERKLDGTMCLVCDADRPTDLAGIMGGENSEIKAGTTEIILELANFNPVNIRKTAAKLGLRTDAATRFEKGLSPDLAELGLKRLVTLIQQLIPEARLLSKIVDVNHEADVQRQIEFDLDFIRRRLGVPIDKKEVSRILEGLHFTVSVKKEHFSVTPPLFRTVKDVSIPEDLVEEVARIYGFDNIPPAMPLVSMAPQDSNAERSAERQAKQILAYVCGFTEVSNYSFMGANLIVAAGLALDQHLEIKNYLTEDQRYLRSSLLPLLLKNAAGNLRFFKNFNLFELGRVFSLGPGEYKTDQGGKNYLSRQEKYLAALSIGPEVFFNLKGAVEALLAGLEVNYQFNFDAAQAPSHVQSSRYANITVNDQAVGYLAEVAVKTCQAYKINKAAAYFEINFSHLLKYLGEHKKYQPLPKFPGIICDIAVVVDQAVRWLDIEKEVKAQSPLINQVELFDVYRVDQAGAAKKSLAFHVHFSDANRTLTSAETGTLRDKIVSRLVKKFKAAAR
ncbi:MAG: Phenylalanine-tRNA ligase beta subunit [Parcubacteria group bacterium GW2011_GWA2_43_17]|nr:MAG: Phenylalanine-tRNA ligase beta subunit [Parcubacteria group bacterium GW2011_GWA2_43_17]KKT90866.1 MAG: Phenylalanine-tRNA ligase beta subunit [Parcubacteria group bacterium GW2011_GWF2_45_11]KKT96335.1 MAG: Phenylalanine-tRNA ligase beta subunit [Parcubacteria group bacterium GW2011_GWC2_45_15]OGY93456.1 MAG: phenylalanine--tRNA ligase subunit beta [Candidatus Komeilibacteria bacterium RIFOXYC2_FULL_45_12]HBR13572.1 phenylalanine--tRNA ligase subunit beta [Candidatus Komeilibacteria ba